MDDSRVGNRRSSNRSLRAAASSATCWGFVMNKDNAKDYLPFVKALAAGRLTQRNTQEGWGDFPAPDFPGPADKYRIKPEPKEIWANRFPDGYESPADYKSEESAKENDHTRGRAVQVCYREVIE